MRSSLVIAVLLSFLMTVYGIDSHLVDNTCTFQVKHKVFSLVAINLAGQEQPYYEQHEEQASVYYNFCEPFVPPQCLKLFPTLPESYSYVVSPDLSTNLSCTPYSSDSKVENFRASYVTHDDGYHLSLNLTLPPTNDTQQRNTIFLFKCHDENDQEWKSADIDTLSPSELVISGKSNYGCPVFQLNSLWTTLKEHSLLLGVIMVVLGVVMLFYGILMTHLVIFLGTYCLCLAVMVGIGTAFLSANSSSIAIYFTLLLIVALSTLVAYALTRLVNISLFFVGGILGFVLAALAYSLLSKLTDIYSVWLLVVLNILLIIPLGLLTFKYSEHIIILSSSLTGAYMVVRPFSWIFGGFPNEFVLYQMIEDRHISTLPWSFFLYLVLILVIMLLGICYQTLKLQRRDSSGATIEHNFITDNIEGPLDELHDKITAVMDKAGKRESGSDYKIMKEKEMKDVGSTPQDQF